MRRTGRFHTQVTLMEDECWIYPKTQFDEMKMVPGGDTYYWNITIDEATMAKVNDKWSEILKWPRPQLPSRMEKINSKKVPGNSTLLSHNAKEKGNDRKGSNALRW